MGHKIELWRLESFLVDKLFEIIIFFQNWFWNDIIEFNSDSWCPFTIWWFCQPRDLGGLFVIFIIEIEFSINRFNFSVFWLCNLFNFDVTPIDKGNVFTVDKCFSISTFNKNTFRIENVLLATFFIFRMEWMFCFYWFTNQGFWSFWRKVMW